MEQNLERKLLYYDRCQRIPRHYCGEPIFHFIFKDVKSGEDFTLGSCFFADEVSSVFGGHYYADITEATRDFDILWSLSDERISPVAANFEEVQAEYRRMLSEGVTSEEINFAMMTLFQEKNKLKKH